MAKSTTIKGILPFSEVNYTKFLGLYNKDLFPPLESIRPNGILLSEAKNVDINDAFKPQRRDGFSLKLSGSYRSLWANNSIILAVDSGNLIRIIPGDTYTKQILRANVGDYNMDFVEVGYSEYVYYSNGVVIGYIKNFISNELPVATITYKKVMPPGHLIELFRGRLYVVVGNLVIYSDGANYNHYDIREDKSFFQFSDRLTMFRSVLDGIWVSDGRIIMFLDGLSPLKMVRKTVADYGAVEGSAVKISGKTVGGVFYDNAVIFRAIRGKGICIGSNSGQFVNLTEDRIITEDAQIGTAIIREGEINQYLSITNG